MELKDLRIFQAVAELGSLHGASLTLGLTQPALSKSVRRLEGSLGVRLFERTPRGVTLTSIGKALYASNADLLKAADDIPRQLNDLQAGRSDQLRVGTVPSLVDHVLCPALIEAMQAGVPASFSVHIHLTGTLLRELTAGHIDMALAALQEDVSPDIAYTVLGEQRTHIVCRRGHPLLQAPFAPSALMDYPWVLALNDAILDKWLAAFFRQLDLAPPRLFVETDASPLALASLIANSDALTLVSGDSLASRRGSELAALPVSIGEQPLQVALCWRRSAYFSASMRQFRRHVAQAYGRRPVLPGTRGRAGAGDG